MGRKVDTTLTEHIAIRTFREKYNLAGQSGKVPSFFDQIVMIDGNPNNRAKLHKKNGGTTLSILPQTEEKDDKVIITIDSKDIHNLEEIMDKVSIRQKRNGKKVIFSDPVTYTIKSPKIEGKFPDIDLVNYKIGFLKIAYEFACDILPPYYEDETAKEISEVLYTCDTSKVETFVIHSDFQIDGANFLKVFGEFKNHHTIHLLDNENGLFCYVTAFDSVFVVVRLSKTYSCKGYKYMLYNNYIENTYWMKRFSEIGFEDI